MFLGSHAGVGQSQTRIVIVTLLDLESGFIQTADVVGRNIASDIHAIKTRSIPSIQVVTPPNSSTNNKPSLSIDTSVAPSMPAAPPKAAATSIPATAPAQATGPKKNLLTALREKYGDQYAIEEVKEAASLNMEKLRACWDAYGSTLEAQQKHSASGTFKMAVLEIENDIHFTVRVPGLTAQKFVEQERMNLLEKIWETFNNRAIQFSILVDAGEKEDVPLHLKLNSKQKFEHIAKQFPLVQQLKERMNLEVNF